MKKFIIIITSIFSPSNGVKKFSEFEDYKLIIVADKKTPDDWYCKNVNFISLSHQKEMEYELAKVLPYNHYSRKMIGYLKAIQDGADFIIDTDDDNIPKKNWEFPDFQGIYDCIDENLGFINIYQLYTVQKIWPRGLPLNLITSKYTLEKHIFPKECKIGVWQGLVDDTPDVDAIYRLTDDKPCYFIERNPIAIGKGTISPFNTQNTIIRKELFPLLYLPAFVAFRFTDILRGLIAQPIMWLYNYQLGFTNATVVQKRNTHDYMKDFFSEFEMYMNTEKIIYLVSNSISKSDGISINLYKAYSALFKAKIVCENEMKTLELWLKDLERIKK